MAVMMQMLWPGIGAEEYEAARNHVNWEGDVPSGGMFHVVAVTDEGVRVTDVWESAEQFDAFVQNRLMPGVQTLGIPGEPQVEIYPVHALFTPAFERKASAAGVV
jgi:hypothetical protein